MGQILRVFEKEFYLVYYIFWSAKEITLPWFSSFISFHRSRFASLNKHHAYFLLVDNGTVGKYGAEIALRRKLEKFISTQSLGGSQGKKWKEKHRFFFFEKIKIYDDIFEKVVPQQPLPFSIRKIFHFSRQKLVLR